MSLSTGRFACQPTRPLAAYPCQPAGPREPMLAAAVSACSSMKTSVASRAAWPIYLPRTEQCLCNASTSTIIPKLVIEPVKAGTDRQNYVPHLFFFDSDDHYGSKPMAISEVEAIFGHLAARRPARPSWRSVPPESVATFRPCRVLMSVVEYGVQYSTAEYGSLLCGI